MIGKKIWLEAEIDLDFLAHHMSDLPNELLLEFITSLDLRVAEWDFTAMIRDYFNGLDYPEVD
ncbi:hypothetical protein [Streptomyces ardesiacus]|uniref:hypothetical protein n=1 Tax=Streptomyces ardesiacus TaxID=285564 RepID=UPI003665F49C